MSKIINPSEVTPILQKYLINDVINIIQQYIPSLDCKLINTQSLLDINLHLHKIYSSVALSNNTLVCGYYKDIIIYQDNKILHKIEDAHNSEVFYLKELEKNSFISVSRELSYIDKTTNKRHGFTNIKIYDSEFKSKLVESPTGMLMFFETIDKNKYIIANNNGTVKLYNNNNWQIINLNLRKTDLELYNEYAKRNLDTRLTLSKNQKITCLFVMQNKNIAIAYKNNIIIVYEHDTYNKLYTLAGHTQAITYILENNNHLITTSKDDTIKIWRFGELKENVKYKFNICSVCKLFNNYVVFAYSSGRMIIWRNLEHYKSFDSYYVTNMCVDKSGNLITCRYSGQIDFWQ